MNKKQLQALAKQVAKEGLLKAEISVTKKEVSELLKRLANLKYYLEELIKQG